MNNMKPVEVKESYNVNLKEIQGEKSVQEAQVNNELSHTLFDKCIQKISLGFAFVSGLSLVSMMFLIVFNGIKRTISTPFSGTSEVVGWLAAITISFGLAFTQVHRGHVEIDLLVKKFPLFFQKTLRVILLFVSIVFFSILAWQLVKYGMTLMGNNNLSQTLRIIYYPFVYMISLGFGAFVLVLIRDLVAEVRKKV